MHRQWAAGIAALGLLFGLAQAAEETEEIQELETILVVGEQPGPGLWKVSKGDHVMWVLATYAPLPKGMIWRSAQVEARIAESQEVLYEGGVGVVPDVGLFRAITLIPAALKASKIPDKKTLQDVLSPGTYSRWLELRTKYLGKDDDSERYRPAIALEQLRGGAFRKHNLGGPNAFVEVGRLRKKYKIKRVSLPSVMRTVSVKDPRGMLKSAQKLELPDVECFTRGLDKVEPDIERVKVLANAWSRGDIDTLRSMHREVPIRDAMKEGCAYALMGALEEGDTKDAAHVKKALADTLWHVEQASVQSQLNWIAAAQTALEKNKSTFAVLGLAAVFSPDGHLEKLRALGYSVEAPQ